MTATLRAGDRVLGLEVEALAGAGGMGAVYRARGIADGTAYALKVLHPGTDAERFDREIELLARLQHPTIARYVGRGATPDGSRCLVMEWIDGEDLSARLARGPLSLDEALSLLRALADGVAAVHDRDIVHRDLKPGNVILAGGRAETPKLLDFGIALDPRQARLTQAGLIGSPLYMSPEQARGEPLLDARTDVWSLGAILFECLVGRPPFVADHAVAVLTKIIIEDAPRLRALLPGVHRDVDALVDRMLAKDRDARPPHARAVLAELERCAVGTPAAHDSAATSAGGAVDDEGRALSILVVLLDPHAPSPNPFTEDSQASQAALVEEAVRGARGRLEWLRDGSFVVLVTGDAVVGDQAHRAATCAEALRKAVPDASIALATGRGWVRAGVPVGPVIDRAFALATAASSEGDRAVRLDPFSATLVAERFDNEDARGVFRLGARRDAGGARTILGRLMPFVGRDAEVAALHAACAHAAAESEARAVLVTAAAGFGKSRLRQHVVGTIGSAALLTNVPSGAIPTVWEARVDPYGGGAPFALVADLVRRAVGVPRDAPNDERTSVIRERLRWASVAVNDAERIATFLGEVEGRSVGVPSPALEAARKDPQLMREQVLRALSEVCAVQMARGPLAIVLDDIHWADRASLEIVGSLMRWHERARIVVLAFGRPEVEPTIGEVWSEHAVQTLRLPPLPRRAAERLVRTALGDALPAAAVERVCEAAGGHAFYLEELIRAAAEGVPDVLPESVVASIDARLGALTPAARAFLRAASLFGIVFARASVDLVVEADVSAASCVEELVAQELIVRRRSAERDDLAFRHGLVRDTVYWSMSEAARARGHARVAEHLVATGERDAAILALHRELGGDRAGGARGWLGASSEALHAGDFSTAIQRAERALAIEALSPSERGVASGILARCRAAGGDNAAAREDALRAVAALEPGTRTWVDVIDVLAATAERMGLFDRLAELAEEMGARLDQTPTAEVVRASACVARCCLHGGLVDVGLALVERATPVSALLDDPGTGGALEHVRAVIAYLRGDPEGDLRHSARGAELYDRAGDVASACPLRVGIGGALCELGALEEAESVLRAALNEATRLGLGRTRSGAQANLGWALARRGLHAEAGALYELSAASSAMQGDSRLECGARSYLGSSLLALGDLDGAERELQRAVALGAVVSSVVHLPLAILSSVQLARGRPDLALVTARRAWERIASATVVEEGEALVRVALVQALRASGDEAAARDAIAAAHSWLMARAARLSPARRAAYLGAIREHARLVELFGALVAPA
jgi:tetratricopeptide (TPR) repeat protein